MNPYESPQADCKILDAIPLPDREELEESLARQLLKLFAVSVFFLLPGLFVLGLILALWEWVMRR